MNQFVASYNQINTDVIIPHQSGNGGSNGGVAVPSNSTPGDRTFVRWIDLDVTLDTDGDGLTDTFELTHAGGQLSPFMVDSDGDGLSDKFEIDRGMNPLSASGDTDGDGISDGDEALLGTGILNSSSVTVYSALGAKAEFGFTHGGGNPSVSAGSLGTENYYGLWSYDPGGPAYSWASISGSTLINNFPSFKNGFQPFYGFRLYNENSLGGYGMSGRGYMILGNSFSDVGNFFGSPGLSDSNSEGVLPSTSEPKLLIAPFKVSGSSGSVDGRFQISGNNRLRGQWNSLSPGGQGNFNFQADIQTSQVLFYYNSMNRGTLPADTTVTIGVQDRGRQNGTLITKKIGDIQSQTALRLARGFTWLKAATGTTAQVSIQIPRGTDEAKLNGMVLSPGGKTLNIVAIQSEDEDGDGMPDVYEEENGLDLDRNDRSEDADGDGIPNITEFILGTKAGSADSDGDTLSDDFELTYYRINPNFLDVLNPTIPDDPTLDFDNDGVTLLDEAIYCTNPFVIDTDGDGSDDLVEITIGSIPTDASDGGVAPPMPTPGEGLQEGQQISLKLGVGDPSGSESERYILQVKNESTGRIILNFQSQQWGEMSRRTFNVFRYGESYSMKLKHVDTDPQILNECMDPDDPSACDFYPNLDWRVELKSETPGYNLNDIFSVVEAFDPETQTVASNGVSILPNDYEQESDTSGINYDDGDTPEERKRNFRENVTANDLLLLSGFMTGKIEDNDELRFFGKAVNSFSNSAVVLGFAEGAGEIEMQLRGVPNKFKNAMAWEVQRNQADTVGSGSLAVTPNPGNSFKTKIDTDIPGSFDVIAYFDVDGDGSFSASEKVSSTNMAVVRVSIESSQIQTDPQFFVEDPNINPAFGLFQVFSHPITGAGGSISFSADLLLEGGGADKTLGTTSVFPGWIGTGRGTTRKVFYAGGGSLTESLSGNPPFLDSARPNAGSGGTNGFRASSARSSPVNHPSGGVTVTITAIDEPNLVVQDTLPLSSSNGVIRTEGELQFIDYVAAYSLIQPKSYGIYGSTSWQAVYNATRNNQSWDTSATSIITSGATVSTSGFPKTATEASAPTTAPTFSEALQTISEF